MSNIIIGASSFLGSNLYARFKKVNQKTHTLSYRPKADLEFFKNLEKLLVKNNIQNIYICGRSQSGSDSSDELVDLFKSNIEMPGMICSLVKQSSPHTAIISFGSSWQFNSSLQSYPFNLYASSKSAAEKIFEHFVLDGIKICSLRLYDTYGKNDIRPKIVNLIVDAIKSNKKLKMSGGEQLINLVHIEDVLDAVEVATNTLHKSNLNKLLIYSVKSNKSIMVKEIIDIYEDILNMNLRHLFELDHYPYRDRERFELSDDDKCPDGWNQKISLLEGLSQIIR